MILYIKRFIKNNPMLFFYLKQALIYFRYAKSIGKRGLYDSIPQFTIKDSFLIADEGCHCFFGYYDKSPINEVGRNLLFIRSHSSYQAKGMAEVCLYDMETRKIQVAAQTNTWNWQQGAMEQWIDDHTISYNRFDVEKNEYLTVRLDVDSNEEQITSRAAYSYNRNFTKYLSLNFYRLDLFAKGYGYPFQADNMDVSKDGIWEVDVVHNSNKLILSLADVINFEPKEYMNFQHYINHVAYCPDERYIIFIHRWQVPGGEFVSRLLRYDLSERKLMSLLDYGHVSHYCWKTNTEMMIYATNCEHKKGYMIVNIETGAVRMLLGLPSEDGHPSYSKDGRWILTDTYPDHKRKQYLFLFDTREDKLYRLDDLYSPLKYYNDFRCDLHPRWSRDNKHICVDNTQSGKRSLKIYNLS